MSIQQAGGVTVNNTLSIANGVPGCIYSQAAQSYNSAFNDIKNQLVAAGWTAVLKSTGVNVTWASNPATNSAILLDGVTYTYKTALSSTTTLATTLSTTTGVTVVPTSGTNIVTGSIIQIDSEYMYVVSGGTAPGSAPSGTNELTVVRGYGGSTPATHNSGATLYIGCEVLIGANTTATATNLFLAITAGSGIGTNYSNGTKAHHSLTAINPAAAWVNVYTKDAGTQTVGKFSASNAGTTNSTISGYSSGTTTYNGGWWLYPARTPAGLHAKVALTDTNVAATTGSLGGIMIAAHSADGAISPTSTSSGLTISITTGGVFTASATTQSVATTSLKVGSEIVVNTTPAQVFTIASITSTITGTVSVAPPVAINSTSYNINGIGTASNYLFTLSDASGTNYLSKIYANKYQFILYRPNDSTYGTSFVVPYIASVDAPYKISNIAASPATGTRFTTVGSHGLATGDSVYIVEPKIGGNYTYFCTNTAYNVTAIDATTFDITNLVYPGGTYTYDANNYAIMAPATPPSKDRYFRVIYQEVFDQGTTGGNRSIRRIYDTGATNRNGEITINGIVSWSVINNLGGSQNSIFFVVPVVPYNNSYSISASQNTSYIISDSLFALASAQPTSSASFAIAGQFWDSFIVQRNAALDSQIVYNGRIFQNFTPSTQTGSCWFAVN